MTLVVSSSRLPSNEALDVKATQRNKLNDEGGFYEDQEFIMFDYCDRCRLLFEQRPCLYIDKRYFCQQSMGTGHAAVTNNNSGLYDYYE